MNNPFLGLYEVMGEATKFEPSFFIAKICFVYLLTTFLGYNYINIDGIQITNICD